MFYRLVSRSILLQRLKLALAGAEKDPGGRGHNNSQLKKEVKELIFLFLGNDDDRSNFVLNIFQLFFSLFFGWPSLPLFPLFGRKQDVNVNAKVDELEDRRSMLVFFRVVIFEQNEACFPNKAFFLFFQKIFPTFSSGFTTPFFPCEKREKMHL